MIWLMMGRELRLGIKKFGDYVVINKPVDKVFAYVSDLTNNQKWQKHLEEFNITSENTTGAGTTYHLVNSIMGYRIEAGGVISEYETNRHCVHKIVSGPIMGQSRMTVEAFEGGTKLTVEAEADLTLFRFLKTIILAKAKKQLATDLNMLKTVLEETG